MNNIRVIWRRKGIPTRTWSHLDWGLVEELIDQIKQVDEDFHDLVSITIELL